MRIGVQTRVATAWLLSIVIFNGCNDLPSTPSPQAEVLRLQSPMAQGITSGYSCTIRLGTAASGRSRHVALTFPPGATNSSSGTFVYRYRRKSTSGQQLVAADCTIPRTAFAVRMMHARFDVPAAAASRIPEVGGDVEVQGCVTEGGCVLDPVVVVAPDEEEDTYDPPECDYTGTCGDWDYEHVGPGGGGMGPGPDGTYRPECTRDEAGHCILKDLNDSQWNQLLSQIDAIREDIDYCAGAKQALQNLVAMGRYRNRFQTWTGYDVYEEANGEEGQYFGQVLSDAEGYFIRYDEYWLFHDPSLVVHEGIHLWLNSQPDNEGLVDDAQEAWVDQVDQNCVP
jgi:hypothetical protein